jgi:hypothetical protein
MAALMAADKLVQRVFMRVVELAECGAHATPDNLLLGRPAEENEACPLQGLRDPGGGDDVVERCAQVHDGDVRGVPFCSCRGRRSSGGRAEHGESPPSSSPRAITSTMVLKSQLSP